MTQTLDAPSSGNEDANSIGWVHVGRRPLRLLSQAPMKLLLYFRWPAHGIRTYRIYACGIYERKLPMINMPPPSPTNQDAWSPSAQPYQHHGTGSSAAAPGWTTLYTGEQVELAGVGSRLGARILDALVFVLYFIALVFIVGVGTTAETDHGASTEASTISNSIFILLVLGSIAFMVLYEATMTAVWGRTLGKHFVGIRVARADNGEIPGWGQSFGRWGIPTLV